MSQLGWLVLNPSHKHVYHTNNPKTHLNYKIEIQNIIKIIKVNKKKRIIMYFKRCIGGQLKFIYTVPCIFILLNLHRDALKNTHFDSIKLRMK